MNIKDNPYVSSVARVIEGSKTRFYSEYASKFADSISFAIGEPDFTTPQHIIEVAAQKLREGYTHYAPNPGIPELRAAIAEKYNKLFPKQHFTWENVVVTSGTQEANLLAMMMLFDPGDAVIVPAPCYISYIPQCQIMHVDLIQVRTLEENGYELDPEALEAAITPKVKAILINSPCNPTGTVLSRKTLEAIVDVARRHRIAIISDETYFEIVYEKYTSILDVMEMDESLIYCGGFSKSYAMTGWRLGYAIATKEMALALRQFHENNASCSNTALQYGAIEAIEHGDADVEYMRGRYLERRDLICGLLDKIDGLSYVKPKGAFYVYINIERTGMSSIEFTEKLLNEYHVVVAPGTAFGPEGEGHIRLSYATSEEKIKEGLARISAFVASLDLKK
ncbi:MAG TPA: pyridoxal phosphate-dependent aminotransferase [Eubacteriales bacterium]|nr:pyridoxal phosphate-dependent aminotransferase [Clostridia bacterium]HRV73375.1 pyridoxal phosphate-dependent aminotransferase [Eubacteriales bacterium]